MALAGFERLGIDDEPGATWIIPSTLSARELYETHDAVLKHRNNPVMSYGEEDPLSAEEMLRRKPNNRRAEYDDDSDGDGIASNGEEDFVFPGGGGPTNTNRKSAALEELKKTRRKRRLSGDEIELDDETKEARRKARFEADLEKRRKIKSAEFVVDSDDEDEEADREFFYKEAERRKAHAAKVLEALRAGRVDGGKQGRSEREKKRKNDAAPESGVKKSKLSAFYSDTEDEDEDDEPLDKPSSLPRSRAVSVSSDNNSEDTPPSSPHRPSSQEPKVLEPITGNTNPLPNTADNKDAANFDVMWDASGDENVLPLLPATEVTKQKSIVASKARNASDGEDGDDDDEDEDEVFAAKMRRRGLVRAVVMDSDDE